LLLAAVAWGQAANPTPAAQPQPPQVAPAPASQGQPGAPAPAKPPEVAPDAAVITLKGMCANSGTTEKPADADCKTVITRAQLETVMSAIAPTGIPPSARKQFATRYAMGLVMADQAQKAGLDKTPRYAEMMKLMQVQVLSQLLSQSLQDKASQIPDTDIEDYYKKNEANYQEASLQRLFIPRTKQLPPSKVKLTDAQKKKLQADAEAAMKTEATALQKRAAAGASFAKLEAEAFTVAGYKNKPAPTDMGKVRRSSLPPTQSSVFDLKPGEISQLISDPGGYFVYKVNTIETLPLDKVKQEIHNTLRGQRAQAAMQSVQQASKPELNEDYFVAPPPKPTATPGTVEEDDDQDEP
jgi:parvulin-like peptidyl-prolyl isomerase